MKYAIYRAMLLTMTLFILMSTGCNRSLPAKVAGTWKSIEFRGDQNLNASTIELQLEIQPSGVVSLIGVDKTKNPPEINRLTGHIEGQFLILNGEEYGKLTESGNHIEILDVKTNNCAVLARAKF